MVFDFSKSLSYTPIGILQQWIGGVNNKSILKLEFYSSYIQVWEDLLTWRYRHERSHCPLDKYSNYSNIFSQVCISQHEEYKTPVNSKD